MTDMDTTESERIKKLEERIAKLEQRVFNIEARNYEKNLNATNDLKIEIPANDNSNDLRE